MASPSSSIVPAQLGFLAIYNPTLGVTDDTIADQIVYYASVSTQPGKRRRSRNRPISTVSQEERNERLRQIGLAQGMVEFGRSFSGDRPVDTVETEKSRVIMHELEPGWWILASVDLTRLPSPPAKQASSSAAKSKGADPKADVAEYSSREVKPAALLLQDLIRAHSVFLLHHDSSLSSLFVRIKRTKFLQILGRYWDMFLSTWNVMLHGNPIVNVLGAIKVAASGELGIGVGEEERGSGEREMLEGLVGRTDGLVDLVVSKFGDYDPESPAEGSSAAAAVSSTADPEQPADAWLGTGAEPAAEDGAIFLGTGALSRHSLRDLTHWMEDIYSWGENAYGVRESATSTRRPRRRRKSTPQHNTPEPILLPPPPVTELARRAKQPSPTRKSSIKAQDRTGEQPPAPISAGATAQDDSDSTGMAKYVDYFKLGYGKYWSIGGTAAAESTDEPAAGTDAGSPGLSAPDAAAGGEPTSREHRPPDESSGHYLIGLMGNFEGAAGTSDDESVATEDPEHNSRTLLRTVTVELDIPELERSESQRVEDLGSHDTELFQNPADDDKLERRSSSRPDALRANTSSTTAGSGVRRESFNSQDRNKTHKLRVVVYVSRPFMFAFLFRLRTDSLAWDGLYKSLHHQLEPLRRPLLSSTSYRPERPEVVAESPTSSSASVGSAAAIYDLLWDPKLLTVHSTIPSIPDHMAPLAATDGRPVWSRVEALNTHMQMLNTYIATRRGRDELERTCKTSRGWWVVWNRITEREPAMRAEAASASFSETSSRNSFDSASNNGSDSEGRSEETEKPGRDSFRLMTKEIFLIRKASDHPDAGAGGGGGGAFRSVATSYGGSGGSGRWADGASRLAQGIGVDTRKYIEGLISMNR